MNCHSGARRAAIQRNLVWRNAAVRIGRHPAARKRYGAGKSGDRSRRQRRRAGMVAHHRQSGRRIAQGKILNVLRKPGRRTPLKVAIA